MSIHQHRAIVTELSLVTDGEALVLAGGKGVLLELLGERDDLVQDVLRNRLFKAKRHELLDGVLGDRDIVVDLLVK